MKPPVRLMLAAAVMTLAPAAAGAQELRAVATIKPLHSLLTAVMGSEGTATLLVDGAASPHNYALKPSEAKALSQAHIVVRASDMVEPFMTKIAATLPKTVQFITLDKIEGLTLLPMREGGPFEAHDHGNEKPGKAKGHSGHGHGGHNHGGKKGTAGKAEPSDGHIWLDPENAKVIVTHLAAVLSRLAPAKEATFKANATAAHATIDATSAEVRKILEPVAGKPFIVFHDAYQYMEARFGVPAVGSVTVSPENAPSGKRLSALRAKITKLGAACVMSEPQFEPKLVAAITEGTRAKSGVLDPLGADIAAGPQHYPQLMQRLAQSLRACLGSLS